MCFACCLRAAEPTTQPASHARPPPLSMREAEAAMGLLGPVKVANYSRTFAPPTGDPHQQFRDRYNYGVPAYSPYFPWCGYGYGYGCGYPCGGYPCNWYSYGSWISPASSFYGD
jgi:hypothetical protein